MIDTLALAMTHGLMLLGAWRLLARVDLDDADAGPDAKPTRPWNEHERTPERTGESTDA